MMPRVLRGVGVVTVLGAWLSVAGAQELGAPRPSSPPAGEADGPDREAPEPHAERDGRAIEAADDATQRDASEDDAPEQAPDESDGDDTTDTQAPASSGGSAAREESSSGTDAPRAPSPDGGLGALPNEPVQILEQPEDPELEVFADDDVRWHVGVSLLISPDLDNEDAFDGALASRGYGPASSAYGGDVTVLRRTLPWLLLGARLGVRGRHWHHYTEDSATAFGLGLQLVVDARFLRTRPVDLGIQVASGLGVGSSQLNGVRRTTATWRLQTGPLVALRIAAPARLTLRLGYDRFHADLAEGLGEDLGGFFLALGVEIRE